MPPTPDEITLIRSARGGDSFALQELLLRHSDDLERHIQARLPASARSVISTEDVLQETLVAVCRDFHQFRFDDGDRFRAWCRGVAENRLKDSLRFLNRKKRGGDRLRIDTVGENESRREIIDQLPATATTPSVRLSRLEANAAVRAALESLPQQYQVALRMRYFDGSSYDAIATRLECTVDAVQGLLRRGKQKLSEAMGAGSWV